MGVPPDHRSGGADRDCGHGTNHVVSPAGRGPAGDGGRPEETGQRHSCISGLEGVGCMLYYEETAIEPRNIQSINTKPNKLEEDRPLALSPESCTIGLNDWRTIAHEKAIDSVLD